MVHYVRVEPYAHKNLRRRLLLAAGTQGPLNELRVYLCGGACRGSVFPMRGVFRVLGNLPLYLGFLLLCRPDGSGA